MKLLRRLFLAIFVFVSNTFAGEKEAPASRPVASSHPVIGMALEGGGALGFAHVGVLKVMEEERVPVHVIAGTSMGSIVAAAYASGRSIEELEKVLSETDWDKLFNENIARKYVDYRMKSGRDGELYGDSKVGLVNGDIVVPMAMVEGQQIEPLFQQLFSRAPSQCSFDKLPVRYRAVAADIETGQAVILDHGSLALAARASMSVPGFFSPVEIDNRLLVDGGITNNFPVDVALSMKPDVLIGVKLDTDLRKRDQITNPLAISGQILDILLARTSESGLALMRSQDLVVRPNIKAYSSTSFSNAKEIMKAGEDAARAAVTQLRRYSVSPKEYEEYSRRRTSGAEYAPTIDFITVEGVPEHRQKAIIETLQVKIGQPYDRSGVAKQIEEVHQTGIYKKVTCDVEEKDGKYGLIVKVAEKEWLKNYIRVGFALEDNFDGESNYSLAANARFRDLNSYGAYLDTQLEIGQNPRAFAEYYQPLAQGSRFFVAPDVSIGRQELTIQRDGDEIAEYQREAAVLGMKGGISFRRYGELVAGWRRGSGRFEREIGDQELPEFDYDIGEYVSRFIIDQYDNPDFPTEGYRFIVDSRASRESAGGSDDFEQASVVAGLPLTFGETTFLVGGEAGFSSDDLPAERSFSLGGFLDISGFNKNSLVADNYWISRLAVYHRFAKGSSSLLNFGGFYGGSVEYSSLRTEVEQIGDYPSIVSGSIFVGADTPLLPLYFGFGLNDESEQSFYLAVGRVGSRRR